MILNLFLLTALQRLSMYSRDRQLRHSAIMMESRNPSNGFQEALHPRNLTWNLKGFPKPNRKGSSSFATIFQGRALKLQEAFILRILRTKILKREQRSCMTSHTFERNVQLSNEKNPGYLLYIGDNYTTQLYGIIINHYKDPY